MHGAKLMQWNPAARVRIEFHSLLGAPAGLGDMSVGTQLREVRQKAKLSLRDLSKKSAISISKLSKVENGIATLRHPELIKLAEVLTIPAAVLLSDPPANQKLSGRRAVTLAESGPKFTRSDRDYEVLCGEMSGDASLFWRVIVREKAPGNEVSYLSHPGEEFVFVLKGKVAVHTNSYAPLVLSTGDSLLFDAQSLHAYFAITREAVLLMTNVVRDGGQRPELVPAPVRAPAARRGRKTAPR